MEAVLFDVSTTFVNKMLRSQVRRRNDATLGSVSAPPIGIGNVSLWRKAFSVEYVSVGLLFELLILI
jgi:aromatic ring-cleaving dioxygenase